MKVVSSLRTIAIGLLAFQGHAQKVEEKCKLQVEKWEGDINIDSHKNAPVAFVTKIPVDQKEGLSHEIACVDHSDHNAMLDSTSPLCDFVALKTCIVSKHDKEFSRSGCQVEITKNVFGTRARIIAEGSFKNPFKSGCEQGTGHVKSDEAWSSPSVNNGIAFEVHSLNQKNENPGDSKGGTDTCSCMC